jgi:hypothetical protein
VIILFPEYINLHYSLGYDAILVVLEGLNSQFEHMLTLEAGHN